MHAECSGAPGVRLAKTDGRYYVSRETEPKSYRSGQEMSRAPGAQGGLRIDISERGVRGQLGREFCKAWRQDR